MKTLVAPTVIAMLIAFSGTAYAQCFKGQHKTTTAEVETEKPKQEAPTG